MQLITMYPGQTAHRFCLTFEEIHEFQQIRDNRLERQDAICDFLFCFFVILICLCIAGIAYIIIFGGNTNWVYIAYSRGIFKGTT